MSGIGLEWSRSLPTKRAVNTGFSLSRRLIRREYKNEVLVAWTTCACAAATSIGQTRVEYVRIRFPSPPTDLVSLFLAFNLRGCLFSLGLNNHPESQTRIQPRICGEVPNETLEAHSPHDRRNTRSTRILHLEHL